MGMTEDKARYAPVDPVSSGLRGRCPRCGEGRLFAGFLVLAPRCTNCQLDFSFADSGDGPAVFVILFIGFIIVGMALWLEVSYGPPLIVHFLIWVPLAVILGLTALRLGKGLLINLQYANKAAHGRIERRD